MLNTVQFYRKNPNDFQLNRINFCLVEGANDVFFFHTRRKTKDWRNLTGDLAFCENRSDYHRQVN